MKMMTFDFAPGDVIVGDDDLAEMEVPFAFTAPEGLFSFLNGDGVNPFGGDGDLAPSDVAF